MRRRPTLAAIAFSSLFLVVLVLPIRAAFSTTVTPGAFAVVVLCGLLFGGIGLLLLISAVSPAVFDKSTGQYRVGRKGRSGDLSRIQAVQFLSKHGRTACYEVNVVLDDGARINVLNHGNLAKAREDLSLLAQFLGVPVVEGEPVG